MRIGLVQMYSGWGEVEDNLRRSRTHMRAATKQNVDLVVFPETSVHGLWKDHLVRLAAEPLDGPIVGQMRTWARQLGMGVGFGLAEKTSGKPYNTYVVLDGCGEIAGVHRKNNVTRLEQLFYKPDRRRPVFEFQGIKTATGICADCSGTKLMKSYGRRKARIVLMPHAWDADPILKNGKPAGWNTIEEMVDFNARGQIARYRTHREMLARFVARAAAPCREHGYFGLFANQVGQPHPLIPFVGPSFAMVAQQAGRTPHRRHRPVNPAICETRIPPIWSGTRSRESDQPFATPIPSADPPIIQHPGLTVCFGLRSQNPPGLARFLEPGIGRPAEPHTPPLLPRILRTFKVPRR